MASPSVASSGESSSTATTVTTHTITYPSGSSSGDLIVVWFSCAASQASLTMEHSFTKFHEQSGNDNFCIFYK